METKKNASDTVVRATLELALEAKFVTATQYETLMSLELRPAQLYEALQKAGVSEEKTALLLACCLHLPFVRVDRIRRDKSLQTAISEDVCRKYSIIPLRQSHGLLYVAVAPEKAAALATFLTKMLGVGIVPVAAVPAVIQRQVCSTDTTQPAAADVGKIDLDTPITAYEVFPQLFPHRLAS